MQTINEQKVLRAKLFGCLYFLLLGLINFAATFWYSELRILDYVILVFSSLPLLINKRLFHLIFGMIAGLISLYMGFAGVLFNLNSAVRTSQAAFFMGYLLAGSMLLSSCLLVYAGYHFHGKRRLAHS